MVLPDVSDNDVDETWGIFLKNEGIGPAVINYQGVMLDGREAEMPDIVSKMREEGALGPDSRGGFAGLRNGTYLGVGKRKMLLQVDPRSLDTAARTKFREFIHQRIDVRFESCSVYDECEDGRTKEARAVSRGETPKR